MTQHTLLEPRRRCSISGCDEPSRNRGWCVKHYTRWKRHGDPLKTIPRMDMTSEQRILSRIIRLPNGCWLWTGPRTAEGYGTAHVRGRTVLVHRWTFEHFTGRDPGQCLDHLCRNEICCNPQHLEPVTHGENTRRGLAPSAVAHNRGTCANGHELIPGVTAYVQYRKNRGGRPHLRCKTCNQEYQRRRYREGRRAA